MNEPFVYRPPTPEQYQAMRGMTRAEKIAYLPFNITRIEMNDECKVYCSECNGYLWSISTAESGGTELMQVKCPCQKDPCGECTGRYKKK